MTATPPGRVIWITGVPGTGKTTLARGLLDVLRARGVVTLWLDSDDLRGVLTREDYGESGRDGFYGAIGHVARLGAEGGATVVVSATANKARYRNDVRHRVPDFREVELTCAPSELRSQRDIKGLYAKSDAGDLSRLPGVDVPWEASGLAEVVLDTTALSPPEVLDRVMRALGLLDGEP